MLIAARSLVVVAPCGPGRLFRPRGFVAAHPRGWPLLAAGLRWHEAGNPEVMGRDAVLDQMSGAVKRIDGNIAVHDVLANDEHVIALINVALRKPDGSEIAYPAIEVAHISDGLITERWSFMDSCPPDVNAFFSDLG